MPRPRKAERYSPLSTFSTAWRTRHSSWRRTASGEAAGAGAAAGAGVEGAGRGSDSGHGGLFQDAGDDPVRGALLRLGLVGQADAVAQNNGGYLLDQGRPDVILAAQPGQRPAGLV